MRLNVIVGSRSERLPHLLNELITQGISDNELWEGIFLPSVKKSINLAHKQIVEYAKLADWDEVAIAEDDIRFTHTNSWNYFLSNKPEDFDIYLGMIYLGEIDENNIVENFTGLTLYIVSKRFYDTFLSVPEDEHLDRALGGLGKFVVCYPFVAKQYNGFSSNTGKVENYDKLLENRKFY